MDTGLEEVKEENKKGKQAGNDCLSSISKDIHKEIGRHKLRGRAPQAAISIINRT